jgi:1-acyl-sn-glycerol-3-phosphate acyltransferase
MEHERGPLEELPDPGSQWTERFDAMGFYVPYLDAVLRPANVLLRWLRLAPAGLENVPAEGPAVLVTRRSRWHPLETVVVQGMLRRHHPLRRWVRPLLDPRLFSWPPGNVLGQYLGGAIAHPSNARYLLEKGELVLVHREGRDGAVLTAALATAAELRAPVIPVVLARNRDTWRSRGALAFGPSGAGGPAEEGVT